MKKKIYRARSGAQFDSKKAQKYGEILEKIDKESDGIKPEMVVEKAKDKSSPLHDYFQWDDSIAGERWRIHQARSLINKLDIIIQYEGEEKAVPAFISIVVKVTEKETRKYRSSEFIAKDKDLREQVIKEALNDLFLWREKYRLLHELAEIFNVIKKVQKELDLKI